MAQLAQLRGNPGTSYLTAKTLSGLPAETSYRYRRVDNSLMVEGIVPLVNDISWPELINAIVTVFEAVGALIIFYGSARAVVEIVASAVHRRPPSYSAIRREYTKKISLALEFFVANDLVRTILEPSLNQAVVLAFIVGIRTVVGWSLSQELKELEQSEALVKQQETVRSQ